MLTIETNNPDIDIDDLTQRVDVEVKKIKKKSLPFKKIIFSMYDPYEPIIPPPIELKDQYHINELIGLRGDHFVESAYRAILQKNINQEELAEYKLSFQQGLLNKKELLCKLRYSPEGKKKNIHIKGLFLPCIVGKFFRIPVIGSFFRISLCIIRLPLLFRNIQRLTNMLIACQDELQGKVNADDYNRNLKRISLAFEMTDQRIIDLLQESEKGEPLK